MTTTEIQTKTNADGVLTHLDEVVSLGMDGINFVRNSVSIAANTALLAVGATAATAAMATSATFLSAINGPLYFTIGIPALLSSRKASKLAEEHFEKVKELTTPSSKDSSSLLAETQVHISPERDALIRSMDKTEQDDMLKRCEFKKNTAWLGVINRCFVLIVGTSLAITGIEAFLASDVAKTLGYSAVLVGKTAAVALQVLLAGTGVIYLTRGSLMLYRSITNWTKLNELHQEIISTVKDFADEQTPSEKRDIIIKVLEKHAALKDLDSSGRFADIYTGTTTEISSERDLKIYLSKLDETLASEILKQKIALIIGSAMILGGGLALGAAFVSSGTSVLAISIVSSAMFILLEGTFLLNDSSACMECYAKRVYKPSEGMIRPILKESSINTEEAKLYEKWIKDPINQQQLNVLKNGKKTRGFDEVSAADALSKSFNATKTDCPVTSKVRFTPWTYLFGHEPTETFEKKEENLALKAEQNDAKGLRKTEVLACKKWRQIHGLPKLKNTQDWLYQTDEGIQWLSEAHGEEPDGKLLEILKSKEDSPIIIEQS